jgi:hypothetical protein
MARKLSELFNRISVGNMMTGHCSGRRDKFDFENDAVGSVAANMFLLTHKCGNNYVGSVFKGLNEKLIKYQTDELRGQMPGPYIADLKSINSGFANIRCRNFTPLSIEKSLRHISLSKSHFFLFIRHPASMFRSAAAYHMRGEERWARKSKYGYLGGKSLSEALNQAPDLESRLIISMTHFGNVWQLIDNWIKCYRYLKQIDASLTVVKTETLFSDGDDNYFDFLAEKMSHHGFQMTSEQLKGSSPIFLEKLPSHSTGEFKRDPLEGYTGRALEMYNEYFLDCQNLFYP